MMTEFQKTTIQIEREMEEVLTPERFRAWLEGDYSPRIKPGASTGLHRDSVVPESLC